MGLRPGYQQTELGEIPTDWTTERIAAFADVQTGPFGTLLSAREYSQGVGVPVLSVGEVREGYIHITDGTPKVDEIVTRRLPQYLLKFGDIVFGRKGAVDRSAMIRSEQVGWFLGSDGMRVRLSTDHNPEYVAAQFGSSRVQSWLARNSIGTTMPSLNQEILRRVQITFPSRKQEECAIAKALSDADALIESLESLIAKKRQIKQGAMQELLTGMRRLPGFSGKWEMKRLGELAEMGSGGTPPSSVENYYDGDIVWVSISDMTKGGKFICDTDRKLSSEGFRNSAAQMYPAGTVLYAMYASLGECSIAGIPLCSSQAILGIQPKAGLNREFLYYFLTSLKPKVKTLGQQGTQSNLNKGMVQEFRLSVPLPPEQTAIAEVLSDMDMELVALEQRLAKSRAIKQGMMQELLTGHIRLAIPGVEAVDSQREEPAKTASSNHNEHFNEAVVLSMLAKHFGSAQYPLGRFRYTKFAFLLHRRAEQNTAQYLRKAAGPYNPKTRYGGAEKIAESSGYVLKRQSGSSSGWIAGQNIAVAEGYFDKWYGADVLTWLEQFRRTTNDELELLTTVIGAIDEIRKSGQAATLKSVKQFIEADPIWRDKLKRPLFSDVNITRAGRKHKELFGEPATATPGIQAR